MGIYSRDEIENIIKNYGDMIYRLAYIQLKNRDNADDIYQEVCIKLIRQESKILPEEHLKHWLLRTTINCCKDYWKSAWVRKIFLKEHDRNSEEAVNMNDENTGYVTECVEKLPEKYRIVIHLYYYEALSQKEIAALLNIKENTVASQLSRARGMLEKLLIDDKGGFDYEF